MSDDLRIRPLTPRDDIDAVAELAREIWNEFYVALIGQAQVNYMVARFQSAEAIREQLETGYEYFVVDRGASPIGYMSLKPGPEPRDLFISKFYLHKSGRGAGTGRRCMEFIEHLAQQRGLTRLWLTVNKGNPSVKVYERLGFRIAADVVMDIGNGFVMDDFRMEKSVGFVASDARGAGVS
jgi:GNAT superfamily N-acetyltransferase